MSSVKTQILSALALAATVAGPVQAQSHGNVPTVRYEGRPVEDIVKHGLPVRNYDGDGRVIVTDEDRRTRPRRGPPVLNPGIVLLHSPWRFGLPYQGQRYIWGKTGYDAVLYDRVTGWPVQIRRKWFL